MTVETMLLQPNNGSDYGNGGENAPVQCSDCGGNYVSFLCVGAPRFDSGKGFNHRMECIIQETKGHCTPKSSKSAVSTEKYRDNALAWFRQAV